MLEELLTLRAEIRMLQVFQQIFTIFAITAMGIGCLLGLTKDYKAASLAVAFFAISWSFAMARNDFLMHRIANYSREAEVNVNPGGYESWKDKHSKTAFAMPLLDITSFAVIFFLFIVALFQARQVELTGGYTYNVHWWLSVVLFLAGLVMIPGAVWLAKKADDLNKNVTQFKACVTAHFTTHTVKGMCILNPIFTYTMDHRCIEWYPSRTKTGYRPQETFLI